MSEQSGSTAKPGQTQSSTTSDGQDKHLAAIFIGCAVAFCLLAVPNLSCDKKTKTGQADNTSYTKSVAPVGSYNYTDRGNSWATFDLDIDGYTYTFMMCSIYARQSIVLIGSRPLRAADD